MLACLVFPDFQVCPEQQNVIFSLCLRSDIWIVDTGGELGFIVFLFCLQDQRETQALQVALAFLVILEMSDPKVGEEICLYSFSY